MKALALCALAACSYPEKVLIDANGAPYGCLNAPAPTTADDPITITGTVKTALEAKPIAGATVTGHLVSLPSPVFTVSVDSTTHFTRSQATAGAPVGLYLEVAANGYATGYYYPPHALTHDYYIDTILWDQTDSGTFAGLAQATFDPSKSQMFVTVGDCNDTPVAGATVTVTPPGAVVRYFANHQPSTTAAATDSQGLVFIANLPPGNVAVNATANGMTWKTVNAQSIAGTFLAITIQP